MAMIQFDYESVKNRLVENLQAKMNGRILPNSTAMHLINIYAEEFDRMAAYNEYLTRESKWSVAQNTSSILSQLELFGYKPHRKKGATGTVQVSTSETFSTNHTVNVLIPKFTRFSDGNLTYCSTKDVILPNTNAYVEVPVVQGELKSTGEFLGSSFSGDVYTIENPDIEDNVYELKNNGVICTEVDWFGQTQIEVNGEESLTYTYNNFEYEIKNISDFSGIQICFAPNSHDTNDHFEFRYLITEGEQGSCFDCWTPETPKSGITKVLTSLTDSQGSPVKLYVRNIKAISGGTDYESVDDMRANAPYTFNRVDKIITRNDYIAAIRQVLDDAIFQIWTESTARQEGKVSDMDDAKDFINNCKVFFSGVQYITANRSVREIEAEDLYNALSQQLSDKKGVTDYFVVKKPSIYKFYMNGKVYYDMNKISPSLLMSEVSNNIIDKYRVDKAQFGKSVYHSDYITVFSNISGINHVDVNVVMYTVLGTEGPAENKVFTEERLDFNFKTVDSAAIALSGRYVFASANPNNGNLIKDLFYIEKDSGIWKFYDMAGTSLSPGGETDPLSWHNPSGTIEQGVLGSIQIDLTTDAGKIIWYGNTDGTSSGDALDVNSLVCRFMPENSNCYINNDQQILIYSDAMGENVPGPLDPWKPVNGHRAGKNDWADDSDNWFSYGAGLEFVGE